MATVSTSQAEAALLSLETIGHRQLYDGTPVAPLVWELHQEWVAAHPGRCHYVAEISDYVAGHLPPLTDTQRQNLQHHVYYANQREDREQAEANARRMQDEGYQVLTPDVVAAAAKGGQKLRVILSGREETYRPKITDRGAFIMPPRSRTKGYNVSGLSFRGHPVFCKLV